MSGVAIVTDTSALFPVGVAERLGVSVVPIAIAFDGDTFDEHARGIDDFYALLCDGATATTAQPSPGAFLDAYSAAAAAGAREVLSIHLDARVSATVASAELAADEASIPVTVVDSGTVSFGVGVCVRAAAKAVAAGASARDAVTVVRRLGSELHNVFVARGGARGRVPDEPEWAVLEFVDGKTSVREACVTVDEAAEVMAGRVPQEAPAWAAVGHAAEAMRPAADALAVLLASSSRVISVERYRVGAAVGAHTGPFSFGAFWWPSE